MSGGPIKVDLHCHSYYSDGVLSPEALLEIALHEGIQIFALTDHDTMKGVAPLCEAAKTQAIHIIKGMELSVRWKLHDIHILGLNLTEDDPLKALLHQQNEHRILRAKMMSNLLESIGIQDAYDKACAIAGHDRVTRPHLAQVLINEGKVETMAMAFKRYLARGRLAYVPTAWINLDDAVEQILRAGGQAVIAHPLKYKFTMTKLYALIRDFKHAGGMGMEVVSGEMTSAQIGYLAGLCSRFELLASSGSDYHSNSGSRVGLGQQHPLPLHCKPIWEQWTL